MPRSKSYLKIPEPWEAFLAYSWAGMSVTLVVTRSVWWGDGIWDGLAIAALGFFGSAVLAKWWMERGL